MTSDLIRRIVWIDTKSYGNLWFEEDELELMGFEVESVGYLIRQDDQFVMLAQSMGNDQFSNILVIPKSVIVSMESWDDR